MVDLSKIEDFLTQVESEKGFEGDVKDTFFDGDVEIRLSIGMAPHGEYRAGSFSILVKTDVSFEELAKQDIYRVKQVEERFGEVEDSFTELVDEYCGYNAYEPGLDAADRPNEEEYDIVFHDSIVVFE